MLKRFLPFIILAALILSAASCGRRAAPVEIVNALMEVESSRSAGATYTSESREGQKDYLSPRLLASAYGIPPEFDGIISAAIHLSPFGYPFEYGAFYCKSPACAEDVALYCRERIDTLTENAADSARFIGVTVNDYLNCLRNATVIISGRQVVLIISSDTAAAKRALYRIL